MSKKFYVSHNNEQYGPYSIEQIVEKIKGSELTIMDYLWDEGKNDWVAFVEHSQLVEQIKELKPSAPPEKGKIEKSKVVDITVEKKARDIELKNRMNEDMTSEWFVLKGDNKFGPFSYVDLIKMLQQKLIFEFDYVWKKGLKAWVRIADMQAFKSENIKELKETVLPEIEEVFFRRRHRRVMYGGTVLVHDNNSVWKGQSVEVSAGGAGVIMENAMIVPGQKLYLHFKPGDGVPPFNAICEVVSKRYDEDVRDASAPVKYGLKFTNISEEAQKVLLEFSEQGEEAA